VVCVKSTSKSPDTRSKIDSTSKISVATQTTRVSQVNATADKSTQTSAVWSVADEKIELSAGPTQLHDHLRVYLRPSGHWEAPTKEVSRCLPMPEVADRAGTTSVDTDKSMERNLYTIWEEDTVASSLVDGEIYWKNTFIDQPFAQRMRIVETDLGIS